MDDFSTTNIDASTGRTNLRFVLRTGCPSIFTETDTARGFPFWTLFDENNSVGPVRVADFVVPAQTEAIIFMDTGTILF